MATPSEPLGSTPTYHLDNKASEKALLHGRHHHLDHNLRRLALEAVQEAHPRQAPRRQGSAPKVKKPKKPLPTFIVPPDPAVITGQREPGERAIPRKHNSMDKNAPTPSIELNERNRPINETGAHDEMLARQIFAKRSSLDPPKHDKRNHPSRTPTG
ncbi:hypothetical protein BJV77DRAFT_1067647 [Russula vinacea]|nr:hypothetical protein BJV77DRAFT_1067647 [Russula vinacea]